MVVWAISRGYANTANGSDVRAPDAWPRRDPSQRDRRFGAQLLGKSHLQLVSLAPLLQVFLRPALALQTRADQPLRPLFGALLQFLPIVLLPSSLGHLGQQLLANSTRNLRATPHPVRRKYVNTIDRHLFLFGR